MKANKVQWENELQSLKNAVINLKLTGCEVFVNHNGGRKKETYFLRDETGNTITGSWDFIRLNHFILGYGKGSENSKARCDTYKKDYESLVSEVVRLSGENSKMKEMIGERIKELEG